MRLRDTIDDHLGFAEHASETLETAEISRPEAEELYSEALERLETAEERLLDDNSDIQSITGQ